MWIELLAKISIMNLLGGFVRGDLLLPWIMSLVVWDQDVFWPRGSCFPKIVTIVIYERRNYLDWKQPWAIPLLTISFDRLNWRLKPIEAFSADLYFEKDTNDTRLPRRGHSGTNFGFETLLSCTLMPRKGPRHTKALWAARYKRQIVDYDFIGLSRPFTFTVRLIVHKWRLWRF